MAISIFLGSAKESTENVDALKQRLVEFADDAGLPLEVNTWGGGVFGSNEYYLETLLAECSRADLAVFICDAVDSTISRGVLAPTMRDNILFEYGMFLGALGRKRVFLLYEKDRAPKLPSDMTGFAHLTPYSVKSSRLLTDAFGPAARDLIRLAKELGPHNPWKPSPRVPVAMSPGSTRKIEILSDCALYIADDLDYRRPEAMKEAMLRQGRIPTKYLYYTHEGAQHWLDLCKQPAYHYFRDSLQNIKQSAHEVVAAARAAGGGTEFDFVSLGPGDGVKDRDLIVPMTRKLNPYDHIFYYPIDVSETLLVTAVRTVMKNPDPHVNVKAILADFTLLKPLNFIYELRDGINFFSIHGNTLGNSSEQDILHALDASLGPGDFLFVEVNINLGAQPDDAFFADEIKLSLNFQPLARMGVKFEPGKVAVREDSEHVLVPGSKTIVTHYDARGIEGAGCAEIAISEIHFYDLAQLAQYLEEHLDMTILYQHSKGMSGLLLARRRPTSR